MASDELALKNFADILRSIDRKYEMIHALWSEEKNFEAKFRTQIPRENDDFNGLCDEWVDLFSEVTQTVWAKKISNTGPKIRFRKQYQCWTHAGKVVYKDLLFDARKCRATLDIKVLTDNPLTRRKNKHIRVGLNVVVKINFNHLHRVDIRRPFSFFVHQCEPLAEAPKPQSVPSEKISQLVAEMVQKGINSTRKPPHCNKSSQSSTNENLAEPNQQLTEDNEQQITTSNCLTKAMNQTAYIKVLDSRDIKLEDHDLKDGIFLPLSAPSDGQNQQLLTDSIQLSSLGQQTIMVQNLLPLQNMDAVKLEMQPQLQQFTQLVVSGPQLDIAEHLLMFDSSQVIPLTSHNLNQHFVQLHNIHNQGQYL